MQDAIVQLCCCANHCHSRQCFIKAAVVSCTFNFLEERERVRGMYDFVWSHVRSMTCVPARRDPLDPFGTFFASYLKKLLQRIRNILKVTWRRCYNYVSGTSCKLLEEDVTTYRERLASYLTNMLQRTRNVVQVTWRRRYNVSGTSCKLLDEDVATYQERLASYLTKMLQRIRNILKVTWRRCYSVSGTGTSCELLEEDVTTY